MSVKFDAVELDEEHPTRNVNVEQSTETSKRKTTFCSKLFSVVNNVLTDPIFMEFMVVATVILASVASSELGIYIGQGFESYYGHV